MKRRKIPDSRPRICCPSCGKLLARGNLVVGDIELVCFRCNSILTLRAMRPNLAPHDGLSGDRYAPPHSPFAQI